MPLTTGSSATPAAEDGEALADEPARSRALGSRTRVALAAALVTGVVVGGIVLATRDSPATLDAGQVRTIASGVAANAIEDQRDAPPTSAVVYQRILPSLVAVEAKSPSTKKGESALGAGVIVNAGGSILTAFHVVDGATRIRVSFADGTRSNAEIATADPENDIAVLTAERSPELIVPAVLGGGPHVGDEAYAVGHPFGYIDSLTSGVVSGLDRTVEANDGKTLHGLIQFDAAVNPGNSGGPLLNRGGQVIGIVTALSNPSRSAYFIGISFAVPIATAGGAANAPSK
ncbi:MAG TPA: trypsin-like peptidase domain-containing protein [Gaiellaceae bacterium]